MALGRLSSSARVLLHDVPCKGLLQSFVQSSCMVGAKRHLLSEDVVKLLDFQQKKLAMAHQVSGSKGQYFEMVNRKLKMNELILKDDLKLLLHLCQSSEDMVTARDAIYRYHKDNGNSSFGEFKFGPLFMRLCYELGLEEMAAATLTDTSMKGFFSDSTSFNITMDMLFMKGCYESALDVLRDMKKQGVPFNRDTYTIATGICYKINTPESYAICCALVEEGQTRGRFIPKHAYCFAVTLALRQNDVKKAQSMYSQIMDTDGIICKNLKVVMLSMSGGVQEALSVLSSGLVSKSSPSLVKKLEFSEEVTALLCLRSESGPYRVKVSEVVARLQQAGQVTTRSLDQMLCHTPAGTRRPLGIFRDGQPRRTARRTLRPLQSTLRSE